MKSEVWTETIEPKRGLFDLRLGELLRYKDLIVLFVRRDFISVYKQTILGPLWLIFQPIFTTIIFILIFNKLAALSTDGIPPVLFYLSGITIWNYFSDCFTKTSSVFVSNASIFGKVYFPRLVTPISIVISNLIKLFIQFFILIITMIYYQLSGKFQITIDFHLLLLPLLIFIIAIFGLGLGIIFSSLTTKYRDLLFLLGFGVQLLMYASPVIYPVSSAKGIVKDIITINPLSPIIENFRAVLYNQYIDYNGLIYSSVFAVIVLSIGMLIFNKVEKSFMDTV